MKELETLIETNSLKDATLALIQIKKRTEKDFKVLCDKYMAGASVKELEEMVEQMR